MDILATQMHKLGSLMMQQKNLPPTTIRQDQPIGQNKDNEDRDDLDGCRCHNTRDKS